MTDGPPAHGASRTSARWSLPLVGYLIAAFMIVVPFLDTWVLTRPLDLGALTWRYEALGLVSQALAVPLLGVLVGVSVAVLMKHTAILRMIAVAAAVAAIILAGLVGEFVLDAQGFRELVRTDLVDTVDRAWLVAASKFGLGCLVMLAFASSSWKAGRRAARR
jgi:hypothetical protein